MPVSRRLVVWFAILAAVLVVTASPASAATGRLSTNTTDSELSNATTLENILIEGSGESASAVLAPVTVIDDFEDGDTTIETAGFSGWTNLNVGPISLETSDPITGSYSGKIEASNDINYETFEASSVRTENLSVTLRPEISSSDTSRIDIGGSGGSQVRIRFHGDGDIETKSTNIATYSSGEVIELTVSFDYSADEYTVFINGTNEGTFSTITSASGWSEFLLIVDSQTSGGSGALVADDIYIPSSSGDSQYVGAPHDVDDATSGFVELNLSAGSATAKLEGNDGSSWTEIGSKTISSTGSTTETVSISTQYQQYRWNVVFTSASGELEAEGISGGVTSPTVSNPSPADGAETTGYPSEISVDVEDPDFIRNSGDSVTVEAINDSGGTIQSTTLTGNGTVTFSYSAVAGENDITWNVTDSYGQTSTLDLTFSTPATLYIREETNTSELVTSNSNLTLRFFGGEQIVEKSTDDGTVDMSGLPAAEEIVIVARADGYFSRRIVLRSLYEQQSVYLLAENKSAVFNEFVVTDRTGRFSDNQTVLSIEKGINQSGNTTWKTLAGDYLGGGGSFSLFLEADARYRVFVENGDGEKRNLGPHVASAEGPVPITVGEIEWVAPSGESYKFEARIDDSDVLRVNYADSANQTESLSILIHERGNESNVLLSDSASNPDSYSVYHALAGNETETVYQVEITASRDGETLELTETVGGVGSLAVPIDSRWLSVGSLLLLVAMAALLPSTLARVGAVGIVAVATGLSWFGFAPIPMPLVGLAGALALFGLAAQFRGR